MCTQSCFYIHVFILLQIPILPLLPSWYVSFGRGILLTESCFFGSNFTAEFVDYSGVRLGGIDSVFGLRVVPSVFQRAREIARKHQSGFAARGVDGGQVSFSSLALKSLAGRDISLSFKEVSSKLQVYTLRFSIFPFAWKLAKPVANSTAGDPISLDLELHDHEAQVLTLSRPISPSIWFGLLQCRR